MKKVSVIMADGVEELEAIGVIDILRRARITVDVYSLFDKDVIASKQTVITNLLKFSEYSSKDYDMLFIPGGPHYRKLMESSKVIEVINDFYNSNRLISAICAAPTILGKMGLLKGKKYTCFTSMNEDFGGEFIDAYSVIDLPFVTGRSAAAVIDFAFDIVSVLEGEEVVKKVKNSIYY